MAGASLISPPHGAAPSGEMQPLKFLAGEESLRPGEQTGALPGDFKGHSGQGAKSPRTGQGPGPLPPLLYLGHPQLFLSNN